MTKTVLVCVLAGIILMTGCTQSASQSSAQSVAQSVAQSSSQSAPPDTIPESVARKPTESKPETPEKAMPVQVGVFLHNNAALAVDAEQSYLPKLTLDENKSASFCENLLQGMGYYYGKWEQNDNKIIITVTGMDFAGFAGDDVKEIEFIVQDEKTLVLQTKLCSSAVGDLFLHQK